MEVDNYPIR